MLRFSVLDSAWIADGVEYAAGDHEFEQPSADLVRLASCSHDAGVLDVTEGLDETAYQSQEEGEAALAEAMADGRWHEGNEAQAVLDAEGRAETLAEIEAEMAANAELQPEE